MKRIIILFVFFMSSSVLIHSQNRSITFETGTFDEILKKAAVENKIIMMDAFTTWCGPCKWMSKNVFTDDAVADYYNTNFVNAKFDMEKGEGIELAKKYEVRAYPTILFINGKGEKVHVGVGSSPPEQFIELGKKANDPKGNLAYLESQYEANKNNARFLSSYLTALKTAYIPYEDKLNTYWETQKEEDLISETNWNLINEFTEKNDSREFKYLLANKLKFIEKYGDAPVEKKIYDTYMSMIYTVLRKAGNDFTLYFTAKENFKKENYHREKELLLNTDLIFYKYLDKNPEKYNSSAIQLFEEYEINDPIKLNEFARSISENTDDVSILSKALLMAEKSLELENKHQTHDTKASILFKLGFYEKALKTEEIALKMAKDAGEETKSYFEMIEKIKAKM